jgi:hypothetical protein
MPVQQPMPLQHPTAGKQQWPLKSNLQEQTPREPLAMRKRFAFGLSLPIPCSATYRRAP